MDRKHGKYVVNIEHSGNQPPFLSPRNYKTHSSACGPLTSTDVTDDVGTNLPCVCTNTGTFEHSEFPDRELQHCQATHNFFSDWPLWKIFLTCLLASVITTAIGVLIVCLVYNGKNNNVSIVIQLPQNHGTNSSTIETSSIPTVPTTITDSTTPSMVNTITTTSGSTSTEPTSTTTTSSTETTIAKGTTLSEPTTKMIADTTAAVTTTVATTDASTNPMTTTPATSSIVSTTTKADTTSTEPITKTTINTTETITTMATTTSSTKPKTTTATLTLTTTSTEPTTTANSHHFNRTNYHN
ncbi:uncharacterized protein RBU33_003813 [Hipposideros larvatus]